ncbi:MAG: hypothetical protein LBG86_01800, partial [Puniceicoccales bacterium]|nr:hypothetical protein [Puniceicoccales bacterium]
LDLPKIIDYYMDTTVPRDSVREFYTVAEAMTAEYEIQNGQQVEKEKYFMISGGEVQRFLDSIRANLDNISNKMQAILSILNAYTQNLQQSYSLATNLLSNLEETNRRSGQNIR